MKKSLLTILSLCALSFSAANAADGEINTKEKSRRAAIEKVPACANVLGECKKLGFVAGGFKEGNGLWRNCFHPTLAGKPVTLKGQAVTVNAAAGDVASCKAEAKEHLGGMKKEGKNRKENAAPAAN